MADGTTPYGETTLRAGSFVPLSCDEILAGFSSNPDGDINGHTWAWHCQMEAGVYEYPTVELVRGLGAYLARQVVEIGNVVGKEPIRILEVAAGRGLLSKLLTQVLEEKGANCTVHAVDDGSTEYWHSGESFSEIMDFKRALDEYKPHIILGAWLPESSKRREKQHWTHNFRQHPTTQLYVLVGPIDLHADADVWSKRWDQGLRREVIVDIPDYAKEGFERIDLLDLQSAQFCMYSTATRLHPSVVIAFHRADHKD